MPRFFVTDKPKNGVITLTGEDAHHACRVLRLREGEAITLCDGAGTDYECEIALAKESGVQCLVLSERPSSGEPEQHITLYMALPKGDKMELIVQKSVELGVREIVPFLSAHCVSRPDKTEKKVARWRKIALEAAKQCGRGCIPQVHEVHSVEKTIERAALAETRLFFYENEKHTGLRDVLSNGVGRSVSLVIGPEGGFAPSEKDAAERAGLVSVSLGTRILRCETAPIAALAAVLYAGGNM
ncbi:16S rRNA (uracil(1498)-N(3))-methyltransferase [Butyricicoccus faecihominis]|uniref:16S rRNA (uracil(1498)-N(3))-methyltransferase n=1 Tax=Butyricicoccus faecihominis TaxID=1712515 RepID=UPI002479A073|nr:16S rRNA (uracil(1498)-N(3))-methyltransferase [Butyricicoccus faecihominis]MCQ5130810.1 16S rRNA (uracil(1498)-N(3))-methyltransferase [Butyricicoccus faecihominis]